MSYTSARLPETASDCPAPLPSMPRANLGPGSGKLEAFACASKKVFTLLGGVLRRPLWFRLSASLGSDFGLWPHMDSAVFASGG